MLPTNGSGSGSCYFRHWPSRSQQKTNFIHNLFCLLLFQNTFKSFFKDKNSKRVTKQKKSRFFLLFCMMIEGSGSIPLTSGSGSGRPKNMWIRWIRIRIRNTGFNSGPKPVFLINFYRQFPTFRVRLRPVKYPRLEIKITGRSVPCLFSDRCGTHLPYGKKDRKPVMPTAGLGR